MATHTQQHPVTDRNSGLPSGLGNPYLFTGRRFDNKTGTYYYRNRYYEPISGQFLSRDPLGYADGMNLYAYTQNDPVNSLDPSGMIEVTVNVTPQWKSWEKPKKIKIGGVLRSGVMGRTIIGSTIAVPSDKIMKKRQSDVIIIKVECKTTKNGCTNNCVRAVDKSIQLLIRPRAAYLRGNIAKAIHEATHAKQIGEKIKSKVKPLSHSTLCGKGTYLLKQCEKQVIAKARTLIAEAIQEWNTSNDSIHALEAGKHDKNPDKRYKDAEIEREAREQAATGKFPAGISPPKELKGKK